MTIQKPPAISGVSSGKEVVIMEIYPSIAATELGCTLGRIYNCIPTRICGVTLSNLLFTLPTIPVAVSIYFHLKIFGLKYQLTNRGVRKHASLGDKMFSQVPLGSIDQVVIHLKPGQEFFPAADLQLLGKAGEKLMVLEGVPNAAVFRETILEARNARKQTEASLATIEARHR